MSERNGFLKLIEKNEDDIVTRLVYADWLDDHGEHEEADRQRKWQGAKEWLVAFCAANNPPEDEEDPFEWPIRYAELVEMAREAVAGATGTDDVWFSCGNNMTMVEALHENCAEFWKNWAIVTGVPLPANIETRSGFSCAC